MHCCTLAKKSDYSLKSNKKFISTSRHPDRDAQFKYLNVRVDEFIAAGLPVISIDTKKKELIGNFKNSGRTWCRDADLVFDHDFRNLATHKAVPYGIYDCALNTGMVVVGTSSDIGLFAAESVGCWWDHQGQKNYPAASELLIIADGGGSNGSRNRLFRLGLCHLAKETGLDITVCHYPPGASKWNRIEHRMFSFISKNWQGIPLRNLDTMLSLIRGTTTQSGLKIDAILNETVYETGDTVPDSLFDTLPIIPHDIFPKWNYSIDPIGY